MKPRATVTTSNHPSRSKGALFESHRPKLFAIAYRMTGSRADADELVSDCWLRFSSTESDALDNVGCWLTTVVIRLAIDLQRSARARRETYVGPWLPEPLVTDFDSDPSAKTAMAESVSSAFLLLLESLSPVERAVLLLHDVFEYEHDEVAAMLERSAESCRQSLHRAREHLRAKRPKFAADRAQHVAVLAAFSQAIATGDVESLLSLLAPDVVVVSDSGGKAKAARNLVEGADHCARLLIGLARKDASAAARARLVELNGWPALVVDGAHGVETTLLIETDGDRVFSVHTQRNPEKLTGLSR